ncbi:DUF3800 domain-containing protein [Herbiconiux sp. KACC 21604]|uniref:DUF3800 domain-containing protein n=1 Tax=unclassified Herbiconiux TaxID=2618217 RepID=UPI00149245EE|nr:DUF3800 domain-containing protein [Herbiconiux sp. SALV-R1]QJU54559.1 DUF3800 domain-containing protein [Herbiconiux sp. SALV-R1]WPO85644.1 DUF3800 domain-containing protein [Herbiconiux sp. KACC 21604]
MLVAYVDESYNAGHYFVAAAVGHSHTWEQMSERLAEIAATTSRLHGTPLDAEFHGHELMGGAGEWASLRGKHREAAGIYLAALRAARHAEVQYLFRGLDIHRLNARYAYPDQPHSIVFRHLLERLDQHAERSVKDEPIVIVADEIATQEAHRRQFASYQEVGTRGYRSSRLTRIAAPINFARSRETPGLQVADLAAYVHCRRHTVVDSHPAAAATLRRLAREIDPVTVHSWTWKP